MDVQPCMQLRTIFLWLAVLWQQRGKDNVMLEADLSRNFLKGWGEIF